MHPCTHSRLTRIEEHPQGHRYHVSMAAASDFFPFHQFLTIAAFTMSFSSNTLSHCQAMRHDLLRTTIATHNRFDTPLRLPESFSQTCQRLYELVTQPVHHQLFSRDMIALALQIFMRAKIRGFALTSAPLSADAILTACFKIAHSWTSDTNLSVDD